MATEHPIILHHFPQSPFSEKIRLIFGLKNVAWTSVLISRIMPTAGPDADDRRLSAYPCDADRRRYLLRHPCITRELERRFPEPTLFPDGCKGLASGHRDVDGQGFLSGHREPRLRLARGQGPAGIHRRPRKTARRQIRYCRHDGRDPADARPVSRQCAVDRSSAWRRPKLDVRRARQPVRYQRLYERLVRRAPIFPISTRCLPSFRPRKRGKRGCARSGTAHPPKYRHRRHWRSRPAHRHKPPGSLIPMIPTAVSRAIRHGDARRLRQDRRTR